MAGAACFTIRRSQTGRIVARRRTEGAACIANARCVALVRTFVATDDAHTVAPAGMLTPVPAVTALAILPPMRFGRFYFRLAASPDEVMLVCVVRLITKFIGMIGQIHSVFKHHVAQPASLGGNAVRLCYTVGRVRTVIVAKAADTG